MISLGEKPDVRFGRLVIPPWILVALVGLVLRVGLIASQPEELTRDRDAYLGIARCVASGVGFCSPESTRPTAYRPPVYPVLLGLMLLVLPESIAVAALNCVCYLLTCWLLARMSGSLQDGAWSKWLQGVAVAVVAFDPLLISYSGQPMTESLATLLATGWVVTVHWLLSGSRSAEAPPGASEARGDDRLGRKLLMLGGLTGMLALCRPSFLPLVPATVAIAGWLTGGGLRRVIVGRGIVVLAGAAMVLAPWTARNRWLLGEPIVATTHGGYTLLLANNEVFQRKVIDQGWGGVWQEESFAGWQQDVEAKLSQVLPQPQTELARDHAMQRMAREWMATHPGDVARGVVFRWVQFWSLTPQGGTQPAVVRFACFIWYGTIWCLAGIGLIRAITSWRKWASRLIPAGLLLVVLMATHAFYWTNARMRAPLVPVIGLLVAKGIAPRDANGQTHASEEQQAGPASE